MQRLVGSEPTSYPGPARPIILNMEAKAGEAGPGYEVGSEPVQLETVDKPPLNNTLIHPA